MKVCFCAVKGIYMNRKNAFILTALILSACTSRIIEPVPEEYKQPYRYLGQQVDEAAKFFRIAPNPADKIIIDMKDYQFMWESNNNVLTYAEVVFNTAGKCSLKKRVPAEVLLKRLGIREYPLEKIISRDALSTYYDHKNKVKIGVSCDEEGGLYRIYFSQKYYLH